MIPKKYYHACNRESPGDNQERDNNCNQYEMQKEKNALYGTANLFRRVH